MMGHGTDILEGAIFDQGMEGRFSGSGDLGDFVGLLEGPLLDLPAHTRALRF